MTIGISVILASLGGLLGVIFGLVKYLHNQGIKKIDDSNAEVNANLDKVNSKLDALGQSIADHNTKIALMQERHEDCKEDRKSLHQEIKESA